MSSDAAWRTGHVGRDMMYYEEFRNGEWHRISVDGEMLMGRQHHMIFFRHITFPDWAETRKDQIIARIKSAFPKSDYEYDEIH
jgi:hypothetical protein